MQSSELRLVAPRRSLRQHLVDVWRYRELLVQLIRKELRVRYQSSRLGFAWSLANPLFLLAIYSIVFTILGQAFKSFSIWILSGLLMWNFFSTAVSTATQAITANGYLVGKLNFPREILPLASVGAALVHLLLSSAMLTLVLVITRFDVAWSYLWLVIPAVITCIVLACAFGILLSAANVYARDTTHLLELILLAWFWMTPIIYTFELMSRQLHKWGLPEYLHLLNPLVPLIISVQRGVYGAATVEQFDAATKKMVPLKLLPDLSQWWYLRNISVVFVFAVILFVIAMKIFDRAEANFAEVM
jgi:ABC-2 type transport system permease protein